MPPVSVQGLELLRFQGKTKSVIEKAINIIFSKCYFNDSVVYTKDAPFASIPKVDGSSDFRVVFGDIDTICPESSFGLYTSLPTVFRKRIIQNILDSGREVNDTSFNEERRSLVSSGRL